MKKIIIANWKMNPPKLQDAKSLFDKIKTRVSRLSKVETVVMPPFVYLPALKPSGSLKLGAQDVSGQEEGPWTGEVSAKMIRSVGGSYVLIGHSERRQMGETNEVINEKFYQALCQGLRAVLCVGEKEKSKEAFPSLVREEIKSALNKIPRNLASRAVIAYEPVWAISSNSGGHVDSPQNFFEMSIYIRRAVFDIWGKQAALQIPILYGGSIKPDNAEGFLSVEGCAGLLVGKSSLNAELFKKILDSANK